jgi:hypothetical protein
MQIGDPELQAVIKLLDALRKDMRTDVQQKLLARFAHTDAWIVCHAGEIAEEIKRIAAELSLYTGKSTMLQVNPAMPPQPVVIRGLVISVARWAMSIGRALI